MGTIKQENMSLTELEFSPDRDAGSIWHETGEMFDPDFFIDQFLNLDDVDEDDRSAAGLSAALYGDGFATMHDLPATSIRLSPPTQPSSLSNISDEEANALLLSQHLHPDTAAAIMQHHGGGQTRNQTVRQGNSAVFPEPANGLSGRGGGGSISDTELLRLEGLTVKSPRLQPVNRLPLSEPPSPPTGGESGNREAMATVRRPAGFREHIYSTIRRATALRRPVKLESQQQEQQEEQQAPYMGTERRVPRGGQGQGHGGGGGSGSGVHFPLSPPVKQEMTGFVTGFVEDPFLDGGALVPHQQGVQMHELDTPLSTPRGQAHGDRATQYHPQHQHRQSLHGTPHPRQGVKFIGAANGNPASNGNVHASAPPPPPPPPAHDLWSSAGTVEDPLWSSAPFEEAAGSSGGTGWWDIPNSELTEMLMASNNSYSNHGAAGDMNAKNATYNLAMHTQTADLPYEYHQHRLPQFHTGGAMSGADLASGGLMIHMPQPRRSASQLISGNTAYFPAPPPPPQPASAAMATEPQHYGHHQTQTPHHPRRARPKAPSSGARYGALTSPRKVREASHSSSSPSPTPHTRRSASMQGLNNSGGGCGLAGVTGAAVRKRRSWSTARGLPRTPSSGGGGGGGGVQIGFVNYTPEDHDKLMAGVAPSGSSKTKARREKEAADRQRRLSEAYERRLAMAGQEEGEAVGVGG